MKMNHTMNDSQGAVVAAAARAIARKALKVAAARNVYGAQEILCTFGHPLMDDLTQQVALEILENQHNVTIDCQSKILSFQSDESKKAVFQTVQRSLRSWKTKGCVHPWISSTNHMCEDGKSYTEADAFDEILYLQAVREFFGKEKEAEVKELVKEFSSCLTPRQCVVFQLMLQDQTQSNVAKMLSISRDQVKQRIDAIRRKFRLYGNHPVMADPSPEALEAARINSMINRSFMAAHRLPGINPRYNPQSGTCISL